MEARSMIPFALVWEELKSVLLLLVAYAVILAAIALMIVIAVVR